MNRPGDPISVAALAYLAAPSFVFLLGWLEPAPGLAAAALLLFALYRLAGQLPQRPIPFSLPAVLALLLVALLWAAFSGGAHLFYANTDWRTRDAVYADLALSSWPPSYGLQQGAHLVLRTAFGYFLPPALLASVTGIEWATTILLAWTALGVALFLMLLPLPRKLGARLIFLGLMVVFFSGMDYPAILIVHGHAPIFPLPLEWWREWTYTSLTGQLFWAPNHALALWLGTALILRHRADPMLPALGAVMLPLLLLWTPFAVIGILPWLLWGIVRLGPSARSALRSVTPSQWLLAVALTTVVAGLLSRSAVAVSPQLVDRAVDAVSPSSDFHFTEKAVSYVQFAAFEFGLLALLLRPRNSESRHALALAAGILLLLPTIRFGPSNDWLLRVSTPSLLILLWLTLAELDVPFSKVRRSARLLILVSVLMLGAITPWFEFSRALLWSHSAPNYGQSLVEQQRGYLAPNYIGILDNGGLQALFRPPSPVPEAARRQALLPPAMHRPPF